jgi:poly(3-hydroxybutyrate) depolymerase
MKNLVTECSVASKTGPNITALVELTKQFELEGKIDPVANLKDDQVFLFVGTEDSGVGPAVGKSVETYYQNFVGNSRLNMNHDFPADHTLPTLDYGSECTKMRPPFIGKCNYDGAGLAFKHIFGDLKDAVAPISTNLMAFDQTPYIPTDNEAHSIGDTGYIYVPTACQEGSAACHLHFSFHGCGQTVGIMGDTFAANTGYNRWAESNNIVLVYPSAKISLSNPTNPIGCWDASGFTGTDYSFKSGVQPRFVRNLVSAIAGI